jgi:hypothetical protein
MRTTPALLAAALLLAPCACSRSEKAPPIATAYAQDPVQTKAPPVAEKPAAPEPEPPPTPQEVAAFQAKVPK